MWCERKREIENEIVKNSVTESTILTALLLVTKSHCSFIHSMTRTHIYIGGVKYHHSSLYIFSQNREWKHHSLMYTDKCF